MRPVPLSRNARPRPTALPAAATMRWAGAPFGERHLDDFATLSHPLRIRVFRAEEMQPLGDRARAHIGGEHFLHVGDAVAGLLLRLAADRGHRIVRIEQAGRRLQQHADAIAAEQSRQAELPGQDDGAARLVVEQDGIAIIVAKRSG